MMLGQKVLVQPREFRPEKKHANLRPAYKMDVSAGTLLQRIKIPISYMLTDIHVGSPL